MQTLSFHETHRYVYPDTPSGANTALTVCEIGNDPALAFLTQSAFADEITYLHLGVDETIAESSPPAGRQVISGMAYNPISKTIWCSSATNADAGEVFAFVPATSQEVLSVDVTAGSNLAFPAGCATNGLLLVRGYREILELRTMSGVKIAEKTYPGRRIYGVSASPWSWVFGDLGSNEIVVIDPFGRIVATAPAPGSATPPSTADGPIPAAGLQAIAFDYVSNLDAHPQVWLDGGTIGDPGTIHHPDTPWNPTPWGFRHRLYVANQTDQIIYAGYLTP